MAGAHVILMHTILACIVMSIHAYPLPSPAFPHVVTLEINNLLIYKIAIKDVPSPRAPDNVRSVLGSILRMHHMTLDRIDTAPTIQTLACKIKKMVTLANKKGKAGGRTFKCLLDDWKSSFYALKFTHATGSPTRPKRKLENDLNSERAKRQKLETDFNDLQDQINQKEAKRSELARQLERLKNPEKRKRGHRGRDKKKLRYKKAHKCRHRTNSINRIKSTFEEMVTDAGFTPVSFTMKDKEGKIITVSFADIGLHDEEVSEEEIEEMLFILDAFNIPLKGYHEIAQHYPILPRLGAVTKRKKNLNETCPLTDIDVTLDKLRLTGVVRSIKEALISVLSEPSKSHLFENGSIKIKLSGDGTRAGKKKHLVNFSFTIIGEDTCKSEQGNYLLAIVRCPENNKSLKVALADLIEEFEGLTSVDVNGRSIAIEKYLGGDLKFLNQIMGIGGFASTFSCVWCKCPKGERFDMSKTWSMNDATKGARKISEICSLAGKKKDNFNCVCQPLFLSVPLVNVVPDTLHLFIRIADQMVYHIIKYLQDLDNHIKLSSDNLSKYKNLQRFREFIEGIGISDWFFTVKDGKLAYDSFTGPEHRRILSKIDMQELIPNHPKLCNVKSSWTSFASLMDQLNQDMSGTEIDKFEQAARDWVCLYGTYLYQTKDVTPYMHILANHLPEAMRLHGNVVNFCQQGLEKLNDLITKWYFRSTNYDSTALAQIMHKQHRIRMLAGKCRRAPKFKLTCSKCKHTGHNKRTCEKRLN